MFVAINRLIVPLFLFVGTNRFVPRATEKKVKFMKMSMAMKSNLIGLDLSLGKVDVVLVLMVLQLTSLIFLTSASI